MALSLSDIIGAIMNVYREGARGMVVRFPLRLLCMYLQPIRDSQFLSMFTMILRGR
jgi:hypothetical protein